VSPKDRVPNTLDQERHLGCLGAVQGPTYKRGKPEKGPVPNTPQPPMLQPEPGLRPGA
jgi:hypothetical protein